MELAHRLRVYVVTPEGGDHLAIARAACQGGAGTVQLRAPELTRDQRRPIAEELLRVCREHRVLSIINDDLPLAVEIGADGVHLGQRDRGLWGESWDAVRELLPGMVLGISVEDPDQAREAATAGADYLGVTVHATPTKADARAVGLDTLAAVAAATDRPVVAIGGLHAGNIPDVLAAGARGAAVIRAVSDAPDPARAVRDLVAVTADA